MDLHQPAQAGDEPAARDRGGRFRKGQSGNPRGRQKGAGSPLGKRLDKIANGEAEAVLHAILAKARDGDAGCAELIFARAWPARCGQAAHLPLPAIGNPETRADHHG